MFQNGPSNSYIKIMFVPKVIEKKANQLSLFRFRKFRQLRSSISLKSFLAGCATPLVLLFNLAVFHFYRFFIEKLRKGITAKF